MMYKPNHIQVIFNDNIQNYSKLIDYFLMKSEQKQFHVCLKALNVSIEDFWKDGYYFWYLR